MPKYVLKMTTKIGKKSSDEPLLLYFSNDGGASFYNADDPRVATRVATDDEIHSRRVQDCITNEASCIPDGEECGSSCDDHLIQKVGDCCSGVSHFAFVSCSSLMCLLSLFSSEREVRSGPRIPVDDKTRLARLPPLKRAVDF